MRRSLSGEGRELQTLLPKAGTVPAARSTKLEVAELSSPKDEASHPKCLLMACAVTRRRFPVGASPTRQSLQPGAIGAVMEVTKWLKPSISVPHNASGENQLRETQRAAGSLGLQLHVGRVSGDTDIDAALKAWSTPESTCFRSLRAVATSLLRSLPNTACRRCGNGRSSSKAAAS